MFAFYSCGGSDASHEDSDQPIDYNISFALDRMATGLATNYILFKADPRAGYQFSIDGDWVSSIVEKNRPYAIQASIPLSVNDEGFYNVEVMIFQVDGSLLIKKTLSWEYNLQQPAEPIVGFQVSAINQDRISLFVSPKRNSNDQWIYIKGDLNPAIQSEDDWYDIPSNGEVPLLLSEGEGLKNFTVKLRNQYFNETKELQLQVLKKTIPPLDCSATPIALTSVDDSIEFYIKAQNIGPLFYRFEGEGVKNMSFKEFSDSLIDEVYLTNGEGSKSFSITIKDEAENHCPPLEHTIEVDPSYIESHLTIANNPGWTENDHITLNPHFDHFEHLLTEMHISGGVADSELTNAWIPFQEEIEITLMPQVGHRAIEIKYRDSRGAVGEAIDYIFLRPFLLLKGSGPTYTVLLSSIIDSNGVTLLGCNEEYQNIDIPFSLPCTAMSDEITAIYHFANGEDLQVKAVL